jgi:carotenoid cleavage dioxygenase
MLNINLQPRERHMRYKITGKIRKKDSKIGIPGLLVSAYDADLFFDDLLGTTKTDDQGFFEMIYSEKDFRELFDAKPDIYLKVYAPSRRLLLETTDPVRFNASEREHFDLEIEHRTLGVMDPKLPDNEIEARS